MSTLNVTTIDACTTIKDSASNDRILISTTSPNVRLANQGDSLRAYNTAKCWGSVYGGTLRQSYNVSSWQDIGGNQRRVNFTNAFSSNEYAVIGFTGQGDGSSQDNVMGLGNKNTGYFDMSSNNQTGGTSLESFTNAGWVVFANNGGA